jgi:hypothetical protein
MVWDGMCFCGQSSLTASAVGRSADAVNLRRRSRWTHRRVMRYRSDTVLVRHSDLKDTTPQAGAQERWVAA